MAIGITEKMFIIAIFLAIFALFLCCSKKLRLYWKVSKFPGPPGIPILGNALYFLGDPADVLNKLNNLMDTYSSPFKIWLGTEAVFIVYDPEQVKTILFSSKSIEKMSAYKFSHPWLGEGLISAPASIWRNHRKIITPAFHQKILDSFIDVFAKQSEIMTELMRKELNGSEFEVIDYVSLCTLDIICETAMGITMNAQIHQNSNYVNTAQRMLRIMMTRVFKIWLHVDFIFKFTKLGKEQSEGTACVLGTADDVIREKKRKLQYNAEYAKDGNSREKSIKKKAFLDLLLEISEEDKFTDKELRDEVNTMIIAGYDTVATTNTFVLLMLAMHPEVQEKVYQELCEIFGDKISSSDEISNEDLNRMKYLENVIKETLRLFPVAPITGRSITEDLDIGGHTLPKDSSVLIGMFKLHRWEKYWPEPMKFNPDRFLPEEVAKRHPNCYLPFSSGPRNCIGIKYAMMAMKVLLSTVVRRYVLTKDKPLKIEDMKLSADPVLQVLCPITMKIEKR